MRGSGYVLFFPFLPWLECRYMPGTESLALNLTNGHCTALKGLQRMQIFTQQGNTPSCPATPVLFDLSLASNSRGCIYTYHIYLCCTGLSSEPHCQHPQEFCWVFSQKVTTTEPVSSGKEGAGSVIGLWPSIQLLLPGNHVQFCPNYVLPGALPPCQLPHHAL